VVPGEIRYPVDDIKVPTSCELHIPVWNKTKKVAFGMAQPVVPGEKLHNCDIPAGFSRVSIDQVCMGFED